MNKNKFSAPEKASQGEIFTGFDVADDGHLVVNREKLHASAGYKRQVDALEKLHQLRLAQQTKDSAINNQNSMP